MIGNGSKGEHALNVPRTHYKFDVYAFSFLSRTTYKYCRYSAGAKLLFGQKVSTCDTLKCHKRTKIGAIHGRTSNFVHLFSCFDDVVSFLLMVPCILPFLLDFRHLLLYIPTTINSYRIHAVHLIPTETVIYLFISLCFHDGEKKRSATCTWYTIHRCISNIAC